MKNFLEMVKIKIPKLNLKNKNKKEMKNFLKW